METVKIDSNIVVVGITEKGGMVLLAKRGADEKSKCITIQTNGYVVYKTDSIAQATTYNPFYPVNRQREENLLVLFNQNLRREDIEGINFYLE